MINIIHIVLFSLISILVNSEVLNLKVDYLEPGEIVKNFPEKGQFGFILSDLRIFCYRGTAKSIPRVFQTIQLQFDIETDDFTQYEGSSPEIVKEHHETQTSIFSLNFLTSSKKTRLKLNPFNQTCIGIDTAQQYRVRINLIRVDFWKVILFCIGVFVFWSAGKLSETPLFYYLSGILLGIFASFLVLVYFCSKLVPGRRPLMYGVLLGGWTIGIYFLQILWDNAQIIMMTYQSYVAWYVFITGFTSFVICYRLGPPENQRSKDLIKWGLQIASLFIVYFSSDYQEASTAADLIMLVLYFFPISWLRWCRSFYARRFPPKPRLLSNEEYYEQGVRETTKALDDLRRYCSSPECKQWRTVMKLKDPVRFASFMEGSSHIVDEEILEYETSRADISDSELSEDDDINVEDESADEEPRSYSRQSYKDRKVSTPQNGRISGYPTYSSPYRTGNRSAVYRRHDIELSEED